MSFEKPFPVIETLDLRVTAQEIETTKYFTYLSRIIFIIEWASNSTFFSQFGGDAALTNGLQLSYRDRLLLDPTHTLKSINEFSHYMYDVRVDVDDTAVTKLRHMTGRLSFFKFTYDDLGLFISPDHKFRIIVQDDLSGSANTEILAILQGWQLAND